MRRATEHRARAIIHQHEIGDIKRQFDAIIKRMLQPDAGIEAQLFLRLDLRRGGAALLAQRDEIRRCGVSCGQTLGNRVIGGDRDKAGPENRIWPGGENFHLGRAVYAVETELQALRLADPVFLHQPDLFRPAIQPAQPVQQFIGKVGDFQEPLAQLALFHQRARTPAASVDHLFVGQHGVVHRVPVDGAFLAVDQPVFVEIKEQCLFVAVIFRLAGGDLAAPVERETQPLELRLHVGDIVPRPAAGMYAFFHGGIFGGHPERIPAHRVQHFMPAHPLVAGQHVAHGVIAYMADVNAPRGIGKHLQHIAARLGAGIVGAEALALVPDALPARVGGGRVEAFGSHRSGILKNSARPEPVCQRLPDFQLVAERQRSPSAGLGQAVMGKDRQVQPPMALRRRSRALVRITSSSRCTVAACTGASTQPPFCAT